MKKPFKIILTVVIVIAVLCSLGAILYKPVYNIVAPIVFDEFVGKNLNKLITSDGEQAKKEEISEKEEKEASEKNENKEDETEKEKAADEEKKEVQEKNASNKSDNKKKDDGIYSTRTTVGVYTENDLSYLMKVISPQDKSRIISILQSCVAASDYPDMARRVSDGLDNADMAYIESYLRARMTVPQKQAILDIVDKYI